MATPGYLDGFLAQLLTARKSHYSEDSISFYLQEETFLIEDLPRLLNARQERLKCSLIRHRGTAQSAGTKCVIYLHGMGSTRLQALSVAQRLPREYCLCMFDMSGSGKSQGDLTTYGMKESQDIQPVIAYLQGKFGLRQFVLWGRSMGAVAALLHVLKKPCRPSRKQYLRETANPFARESRDGAEDAVKAIVLDSPFHNFRDVVKEKATNDFSLPSFLADTAADYMQASFGRILAGKIGEEYNPFKINFTQEITLSMPIIMVYSERDEVVPASHSQRLIKNIRSKYQKILINECNHNEARPPSIISSIFQKLDKYTRNQQYQGRRLTSDKSAISYSCEKKRGIFVFTPSKQKESRMGTQVQLSQRKFIPPHASNHLSSFEYASFGKESPKSTMMTPRKTKLSLQSSQMLTRPKEDNLPSQIVTIDTETNSLISKKLVGVTEDSSKGKNPRCIRFNMDRRREMKAGRQRYPE